MIENRLLEGRIVLVHDPGEVETADVMAGVVRTAVDLIEDHWGLGLPPDCRLYVMTSWWSFVFQSAPWTWKILLGVTLPLWAFRARRTWPYSAAWTQRYGRRVAIGVKPHRLWEKQSINSGRRIFIEQKDPWVNVEHVTCHELTHACSAHLRLPPWLNEGLAVVTVDKYAGKPTVREGSLDLIKEYRPKTAPPTYREMSRMGLEAIVYHAVRGYWILRYLEAVHPGFLRQMLSRRRGGQEWEQAVAAQMNMAETSFWREIDERIVDQFGGLVYG